MIEDLAKSLVRFAAATTRFAYAFTHRYRVALLAIIVFFLGVNAIYRKYQEVADDELVIFTGLPGSNCHEIAEKLRENLKQRSTAFGGRYKVRVEEMRGVDEIQERIRADSTGRAVGFAQDEHGNAPEALTVAPLELDFLHFIAGKKFLGAVTEYNRHNQASDDPLIPARPPEDLVHAQSVHIHDFIRYLNSGEFAETGRVYFGPLRSETRRLAELVFQQCGVRNTARLGAHGINDWYEIRAALNTGDISLAFYIGPLGSEVITGIADDGNCRLVNLDQIAQALHAEHTEFKAAPILKQSYVAAAYRKDALKFCDAEVMTLTSRNVIVCSRMMSDFDAWQVASAADESLQGDYPNGLWRQSILSGGTEPIVTVTPAHKGAGLKRDSKDAPAEFWSLARLPAWATALITAIGLLLVSGALERMTGKLSPPRLSEGVKSPDETTATAIEPPPVQPAPGTATRSPELSAGAPAIPAVAPTPVTALAHPDPLFDRESLRFDHQIAELESRAEPMSADEWSAAQRDLQNERAQVHSAFVEGRLTRNEAHVLFQALRNIHAELEFLKPALVTSPKRLRGRETHS
jgi:hypothetical protein